MKKVYDYNTKFIDDYHENLAKFNCYDERNGGVWGFVDKKLNVVIEPVYSKVGDFNNKIAVVKTKGRNGFYAIDKKGKELCGPFEDIVSPGYNNRLLAARKKEHGLFGYVNLNGIYKIKPIFQLAFAFDDNLLMPRAIVVIDNGFFLINKKGDIVSKQIAPYTGL